MPDPNNVLDKIAYARQCLQANPIEEPRLDLFLRWLYDEASADELVLRFPVLTRPNGVPEDF